MTSFDPKSLADLWLAGSQAMFNAQKSVAESMGQAMGAAMGQSPMGPDVFGQSAAKAMADGMGAFGASPDMAAASEGLAQANQSMMEMWSAATQLFQSLATKMPGIEGSAAAQTTLRSMMDPRTWTAGGGEMDDVLTRMADGPRFADLWDMERRTSKVAAAWVEVRRAGLEHNGVVLQAWMEAGRQFTEEWAGHASVEATPPDAKAAMALWTETANRTLLETQRSDAFLRTQTATIRASTNLRLAQQELVEHVGRNYGFPTRTELDDVHRTLTELRREVRAMKRAQRAAVPTAPVVPPAASPEPVLLEPEPDAPAPAPEAPIPPSAARRPRRAAKRSV